MTPGNWNVRGHLIQAQCWHGHNHVDPLARLSLSSNINIQQKYEFLRYQNAVKSPPPLMKVFLRW